VAKRVFSRLRRVLNQPSITDLTIAVAPELRVCEAVLDICNVPSEAIPKSGVWSRLIEPQHIEEDHVRGLLNGKTAGDGAPTWHNGSGGAPILGAHTCRVRDALYTPEFGAVITTSGDVLHSSVAEALYFSPTLAALPGVRAEGDLVKLSWPDSLPTLSTASIFVPWGARFNYGHFLLDSLPALEALREQGLLHSHPPVAPPLVPWQRELLDLYLNGECAPVVELDDPIIQVEDAVFASPMDHFLHAPNRLLTTVRDRILSRAATPGKGPRRIYLSRRSDSKRHMINEDALEAALHSRGFAVVKPEELTISEQISLFRNADVVVGATGAALANGIFCQGGSRIIEIQPTNFVGIWVRSFCILLDLQWYGFFSPSPFAETDILIENVPRPGTQFSWQVDLPGFLEFLDVSMS
jgi:capsular polysaccharide biosynthesis protein